MKRLHVWSILFVGLFTTQIANAQQVEPAMTTSYSNEAIAGMIRQHRASRARETMPSVSLQQKFVKDFPRAADSEWEFGAGVYEVEFDVRFRDYVAYYDEKGELLMVVREIARRDLPAVVKTSAEDRFPKYRFETIEKIQRGSEIFYRVEMELRDNEVQMVLKSDGTVLENGLS
ncbi:MAG: hypothetical protein LBM61_08625 [Prevotellaceae bacterium]|jgi:hypothetical protein|nr:hypothetical protein [Prevotellaceae bacterium]